MYGAYLFRLERNVCKKKTICRVHNEWGKKLCLHYVHTCLVTSSPTLGCQFAVVSSELNFLGRLPPSLSLYSSWSSWRNCSSYVPQTPERLLLCFQLCIKYVLNHVKKDAELNNIYSSSSYRCIISISLETVSHISDTIAGMFSRTLSNWHHLSNWLTKLK